MVERVRAWILTLSLAVLALCAAQLTFDGLVPVAEAQDGDAVQCVKIPWKSPERAQESLRPLAASSKAHVVTFGYGTDLIACGW